MLLIVGGSKDHNIARMAEAAGSRGIDYRVIHTDAWPAPRIHWQPGQPALEVDGEVFLPAQTQLFIRYDVFGETTEADKAAFYDSLRGWAAAYPQVGIFNRGNESLEMSKPRALVLAQVCGFEIPETFVTSDFNRIAARDRYIAKPVGGGAYTRLLREVDPQDARPYIVQEKLDYPELRLFRAGSHYFAFRITSPLLDYRAGSDFTLDEVAPPPALVAAMEKLTAELGLDYAAADFKTDPETGRLKFLEVNTMPMFTGYDDAARGRLSDAMVLALGQIQRNQMILAAKKQKPRP